ncbi:MAG: chemotaxis protein CheB [Sphingobacteriia bacterium]|jgi:two-component system, chemotaxis family, protein-glutamate methylesterase/glutaminase|nr:MAG: chemotaxis protein CheB [Sphingobacteriia bacterium]
MNNALNRIIMIGGSAGSLPIFMRIVQEMPINSTCAMVLVIHRLKNVQSSMVELLSVLNQKVQLKEPDDKEPIYPGVVYLAPQNYHLLIDPEIRFSLDYSEPVNYSRPSIDLSFESAASVFGKNCMGILLSGANQDGAIGLNKIYQNGGVGIVQDPTASDYSTMPNAALAINPLLHSLLPDQLIHFLQTVLNNK